MFDTFEDGRFPGWKNGRVTDGGPIFTKFLGRYDKNDKNKPPEKTYTGIPTDADFVLFEFDFYEIDEWDKDYLCVIIDGKRVDIERFTFNQNENGRSATRQGVNFKVASLAPPKQIGFQNFSDQIHHVTMKIPKSFFGDGKITIKLQAMLSGGKDNESAGFDNVKLTAVYNCNGATQRPTFMPTSKPGPGPGPSPSPGGCTPQKKVLEENFENSKTTGWKNGRIDSAPAFTKFLGRYDVNDRKSDKFPEKTYSGLNPKANSIKLQLDFYEIDSWDGTGKYGPDLLWIRIDGVKLAIGPFAMNVDEKTKSGGAFGISWSSKSLGPPAHLGFNGGYLDQKHRFTIIIPKEYYADGKITVKLGAEITSEKWDESAGYDNIIFFEMYNCKRRDLGELDDDMDSLEEEIELMNIWGDEKAETDDLNEDEAMLDDASVEVEAAVKANLRGNAVF